MEGKAGAVDIGRRSRIVIAGPRNVARLRPDGRLDRGFGNRGIVTLASEDAGEPRYGLGPSSLAIDPRGGVFVAGRDCSGPSACEFAVTRLRRDGRPKRSFGDGGTARIGFGTNDAEALAIAIARGGKLIVAGTNCESLDRCHVALSRLDRNGMLDRSFGDGGSVADSLRCPDDGGQAMALDSHGRIVVGGSCERNVVSLARYKPNGQLDGSFGNGGLVNKRVLVRERMHMHGVAALAIDSRDRIVVAGGSGGSSYVAARFDPDGKLDRSFGGDGSALVRIHGREIGFPFVTSAAIDTRGRIVVAGSADHGFAFARFGPGGKVDRHFGEHGQVVIGRKQGLIGADSVAIDRRNRIVGAGQKSPHRGGHPALVRLLG